ncbi:MAG: PAS domain S-box protein, partial [Deltaproteobacteria bacterium]|nr:PAS domain S-box protein [Deltaproteobacteria bacterium]
QTTKDQLEAQYRAIPVPTYTWKGIEGDLLLLNCNDAAHRITRGKIEEWLGKKASDLYHDEPEILDEMKRCLEDGTTIEREMFYVLKTTGEGKYLSVKYSFAPPDLVIVHTEDITDRKLAEQSAAEAAEFNRSILTASPVGIATYRSDGQCVSANEAIASIIEATMEQVLGQSFRQIGAWQRSGLLAAAEEVLETGISKRVEVHLVTTFGKEVWTDCSFSRFISGGDPFLLLTVNDVSALKKVQIDLRESEARYRSLFDDSKDGVYATTRDGTYLEANKSFLKLVGYTRQELMATNAVNLYMDPNDRLRFQDLIERNGYVQDHEVKFLKKDGTEIDCLITSSLRRDQDGTIVGYQGIIRDITAQNRMEEARYRDQQFLEAVLENIEDGIVACNSQGVLTLFNRATREFHGLPQEALPSGHWAEYYDLYYSDGTTRMREEDIPLYKAWKGEKVQNVEMVIAPKHAPARTILASGGPLLDPDGRSLGAVVVMHDTTERKKAEEALKNSEALLKEAQRVAHIGHCELDLATGIPSWSEEIFHIFGLDPEEGEPSIKAHQELVHPEDWELLHDSMTRASTQGVSYDIEFRVVRPDRSIRWLNVKGYPTRNPEGAIVKIFGTAQDITDSKHAQDALKESEQRFRTISETITEVFWMADVQVSTMFYVSPAYERVWGRSPASLYENPRSFLDAIHEDDRQRVIAGLEVQKAGQPFDHEYRIVRPDGTIR